MVMKPPNLDALAVAVAMAIAVALPVAVSAAVIVVLALAHALALGAPVAVCCFLDDPDVVAFVFVGEILVGGSAGVLSCGGGT